MGVIRLPFVMTRICFGLRPLLELLSKLPGTGQSCLRRAPKSFKIRNFLGFFLPGITNDMESVSSLWRVTSQPSDSKAGARSSVVLGTLGMRASTSITSASPRSWASSRLTSIMVTMGWIPRALRMTLSSSRSPKHSWRGLHDSNVGSRLREIDPFGKRRERFLEDVWKCLDRRLTEDRLDKC